MSGQRQSGLVESIGSQRKDHFVNLERRRDRHEAHTHSQGASSFSSGRMRQYEASHQSLDKEVHSLERKLERLCRRLRRKTRVKDDRTPPSGQYSSTSNDESYQPRSRTPPSDSFTSSSQHTSGLRHHRKKFGTPPRRGQRHDAMGKALL